MEQNPIKRNLISTLIALGLSAIAILLTENNAPALKESKHAGNEIKISETFHSTAASFFD